MRVWHRGARMASARESLEGPPVGGVALSLKGTDLLDGPTKRLFVCGVYCSLNMCVNCCVYMCAQ